MGNDIFDPKNVTGGITGGDVVKYYQAGASAMRWWQGGTLRKKLTVEGYDPVTIEAAVEALKAGRDPQAIIAQADHTYAMREKQSTMRRNPPKIHGSAHWSTSVDLRGAGLLRRHSGREIDLGAHAGQSINWDGESHLLTVAPTRTGKSTLQIVPNLLRYKGSALVLDPKGELYAQTANWRRENVGPVYALNPFGMPGVAGTTNVFNPLEIVEDSQSARKLAEMIYPRTNEQNAFFDNEAIGFLAAAVELFALHRTGSERSLGALRDSITGVNQQLFDLLGEMIKPGMPPSIANAAKGVMTKSKDTGKPRLMDSIAQHLSIWDHGGLRECTTGVSDFDFWDLKEKPCTIYLILPFEEIEAYSTFVQMMLASALGAMLENKKVPDIPVLFVLDEFLTLAADNRFVSALRTHASAGVRLWFFLQDLPTLEQKYPTTWKSFLQAEARTFFGTDDPYTSELISRYLGDTTVAYEVPDLSASLSGGEKASASYSISKKLNFAGRKLLTPDEVQRFMASTGNGSRKAIHVLRDVPPVAAELTPWFKDPVLKGRVPKAAQRG